MTAAGVGVVTSAILGVFAVVGLVVRYVLLPYLRDQVVKPVQETHRQVTPHDRPPDAEPTIVDRLDDVQSELRDLRETGEGLAKKAEANRRLALAAGRTADAAHRRLGDHEAWAREEDSRLWRALSEHRQSAGHEERKPQ
jgi:hypothetical protein